ncbi:cell wall protein TIR4 [Lingula anatina]|uniref:Cell wall protein TIR4 n=1 Tax=Lingula anatina TaxID=7574 RepID=A0A1S3JIV9_LINAN|nr:cell wall protein TIR4 [Lingula anatina]|eukprot:XP_013409839.1 cell wall protein TIR4 [Lingula anatina]
MTSGAAATTVGPTLFNMKETDTVSTEDPAAQSAPTSTNSIITTLAETTNGDEKSFPSTTGARYASVSPTATIETTSEPALGTLDVNTTTFSSISDIDTKSLTPNSEEDIKDRLKATVANKITFSSISSVKVVTLPLTTTRHTFSVKSYVTNDDLINETTSALQETSTLSRMISTSGDGRVTAPSTAAVDEDNMDTSSKTWLKTAMSLEVATTKSSAETTDSFVKNKQLTTTSEPRWTTHFAMHPSFSNAIKKIKPTVTFVPHTQSGGTTPPCVTKTHQQSTTHNAEKSFGGTVLEFLKENMTYTIIIGAGTALFLVILVVLGCVCRRRIRQKRQQTRRASDKENILIKRCNSIESQRSSTASVSTIYNSQVYSDTEQLQGIQQQPFNSPVAQIRWSNPVYN